MNKVKETAKNNRKWQIKYHCVFFAKKLFVQEIVVPLLKFMMQFTKQIYIKKSDMKNNIKKQVFI